MAVITVTKDNFEEVVLKSDKKVVLDFWATWCGPCKMQSPVIDAMAEEREDVVFGKVNVDEEMELSFQFKVMSIPTLMIFENGKVVNKTVGFTPKPGLEALLK